MDRTDPASAPKLDLDELMERIRAEVEERRRTKSPAPPAKFAVAGRAPANASALRQYRAAELLALPSAEFVRCGFFTAFGREPDASEFAMLLDRILTDNASLLDMLREFHVSKGSRGIPGLPRQMIWNRLGGSAFMRAIRGFPREIRNVYRLPGRFKKLFLRVDLVERTIAENEAEIAALKSAIASNRTICEPAGDTDQQF